MKRTSSFANEHNAVQVSQQQLQLPKPKPKPSCHLSPFICPQQQRSFWIKEGKQTRLLLSKLVIKT